MTQKAALAWLAESGLAPWVAGMGLEVDIRLVDGEVRMLVLWPDGMAWDGDRWIGAERHRADFGVGSLWKGWGPVVVCETVLDAEILCLQGHRAIWCGAVQRVRLRRLLPVSPAAYRAACRVDCADLWRPL